VFDANSRPGAKKARRAGPPCVGDRSVRLSDLARQGGARPRVAAARPAKMTLATPQSDPAGKSIERLCVEYGLKMTGQRRVIARVLSEAEDHPDVEELCRRAVQLDARISIATVYRTVRLFEEKGILHRRDFGSGRSRYEPTDHGQHHHLIDVETGHVLEFKNAEHEKLIRSIAEQLGFDLISLRLELFGKRRAT
jgi:Fur family transcriptional regulator, ferric uptake regulator